VEKDQLSTGTEAARWREAHKPSPRSIVSRGKEKVKEFRPPLQRGSQEEKRNIVLEKDQEFNTSVF